MKKNKKLDEDIILFDDDDLELTDNELDLLEEIDEDNPDEIDTANNIIRNNFDELDDFSDFDDFQISELESEISQDFNLNNDLEINNQTEINFQKLEKEDFDEQKQKKYTKNDIISMDYDTIEEYLDLSDDPSMIRKFDLDNSGLDEDEEHYLNETLIEKLKRESVDEEKTRDINVDKLNFKKTSEAVEPEKTNKLLEKILDTIKKEPDDDDLSDLFIDDMYEDINEDTDDQVILENLHPKTSQNLNQDLFLDLDDDSFDDNYDDMADTKIDEFDTKKDEFTSDEIDELIGDESFIPIDLEKSLDNDVNNPIEEPIKKGKKSLFNIKKDSNSIDENHDVIQHKKEKSLLFGKNRNKTIDEEEVILQKKEKKSATEDIQTQNRDIDLPKEKAKKRIVVPVIIIILLMFVQSAFIFIMMGKIDSKPDAEIVENNSDKINELSLKIEDLTKSYSSLFEKYEEKQAEDIEETANLSEIIKSKMPSVVSVSSKILEENNEKIKNGTGIIIDKNDTELVILTNNHVINKDGELSITFNNNKTVSAINKAMDTSCDLATISVPISSIDTETLESISVAELNKEAKVNIGDDVIVIGNAFGQGQVVTKGIISSTNKSVEENGTVLKSLIQTDAAINHGNSGGPIINTEGEIIGICVAKSSNEDAENMGFAIPISVYIDTINKLKTTVAN